MLDMKISMHCIAVLVGVAFLVSSVQAQNTTGQTIPSPEPPTSQDKKVKDASGKQITVDHGANLAIGPNDKVEFNSQVMGSPATPHPVMILSAGWIYLYEGGFVYKIRQSDMKLIGKTAVGPDSIVEPPPVVKHVTKSRSSKRKRH